MHFIETPYYKTNTFTILVRTKLKKETATATAILAELMNNYEDKYSLLKKLNHMYGAVFDVSIIKKGNEQIILFYGDVINNFGDDVCLNVYKILLESLIFIHDKKDICDTNIEKSKSILKTRILSEQENKREFAVKRCVEITCKDESFGINAGGYIDDIEKISKKDLIELYNTLLEESKIDIIVCGVGRFKSYFDITNSMLNFDRRYSKTDYKDEKNKEVNKENLIKEIQDLTQSKLCISARTASKLGDRDFYSLCVLNEILGGGGSSRLFSAIRENEGLCYYISSFIYRLKPLMIIEAGVDEKSVNTIIDKVKETIEGFTNGNFTDEEIKSAKQSLLKNHEQIVAEQAGIADQYLNCLVSGQTFDMDSFYNNIESVCREGIISQAKGLKIDTVYLLTGGEIDA